MGESRFKQMVDALGKELPFGADTALILALEDADLDTSGLRAEGAPYPHKFYEADKALSDVPYPEAELDGDERVAAVLKIAEKETVFPGVYGNAFLPGGSLDDLLDWVPESGMLDPETKGSLNVAGTIAHSYGTEVPPERAMISGHADDGTIHLTMDGLELEELLEELEERVDVRHGTRFKVREGFDDWRIALAHSTHDGGPTRGAGGEYHLRYGLTGEDGLAVPVSDLIDIDRRFPDDSTAYVNGSVERAQELAALADTADYEVLRAISKRWPRTEDVASFLHKHTASRRSLYHLADDADLSLEDAATAAKLLDNAPENYPWMSDVTSVNELRNDIRRYKQHAKRFEEETGKELGRLGYQLVRGYPGRRVAMPYMLAQQGVHSSSKLLESTHRLEERGVAPDELRPYTGLGLTNIEPLHAQGYTLEEISALADHARLNDLIPAVQAVGHLPPHILAAVADIDPDGTVAKELLEAGTPEQELPGAVYTAVKEREWAESNA